MRTRALNPGRPTDGNVLLKLARCERCGAPMHGTKGGRNEESRRFRDARDAFLPYFQFGDALSLILGL
jgi:hypothetical protein